MTCEQVVHRLDRNLQESNDQRDILKSELHGVSQEVIALRAQLLAHDRVLSTTQSTQEKHSILLQDVAVLRSSMGFLQAASDRADLSCADNVRQLSEMRTELAGLQQRHATLSSSSAAELAAHRQALAALRSSVETATLQQEALQGDVGALKANEATGRVMNDRGMKVAKRQELLMQRLSEGQEAQASELRGASAHAYCEQAFGYELRADFHPPSTGLIKAVADQLKPLHETSRKHGNQIEEISSGINVLAELLKFTNRSRSQSLANVLDAR